MLYEIFQTQMLFKCFFRILNINLPAPTQETPNSFQMHYPHPARLFSYLNSLLKEEKNDAGP